MTKFAILVANSGATFVKDYDFFVFQGGLVQGGWGKNWEIIEAPTRGKARLIALKRPGASASHLYCNQCGYEKHAGQCTEE